MGPNGAGKTSLIDAISGFTRMATGSIELLGQDITGHRAFSRARLGLGRTFQNLELFDDMSVRENILAAQDGFSRSAYVGDMVHPGKGELTDAAERAVRALGLERYLATTVADLPQGRRRMVAIARLIAQEPAAILLDEPAAGLSGSERRNACGLFRALAEQLGAAVLLVEHNVDVISASTDELIVLDFGRVIASGATQGVLDDPSVRAAYLGKSDLKKGGVQSKSRFIARDGVTI
jgi:sulfate-transporting ATPase